MTCRAQNCKPGSRTKESPAGAGYNSSWPADYLLPSFAQAAAPERTRALLGRSSGNRNSPRSPHRHLITFGREYPYHPPDRLGGRDATGGKSAQATERVRPSAVDAGRLGCGIWRGILLCIANAARGGGARLSVVGDNRCRLNFSSRAFDGRCSTLPDRRCRVSLAPVTPGNMRAGVGLRPAVDPTAHTGGAHGGLCPALPGLYVCLRSNCSRPSRALTVVPPRPRLCRPMLANSSMSDRAAVNCCDRRVTAACSAPREAARARPSRLRNEDREGTVDNWFFAWRR